jgi:hypothetical protein
MSAGIGAMRRIKPYVPPATLQTINKRHYDVTSADMLDTFGWETLNI